MNEYGTTKVIKDIRTDDCEISMRAGGKNYLLAKCSAVVQVSENEEALTIEDGTEYPVIGREYSLLICDDIRYYGDITVETLREASRYDVKFGIDSGRQAGKYIMFENIKPIRIDLYGEWQFKLSEQDGAMLLDSIE